MTYRVLFTQEASRVIKKLDHSVKVQIGRALDRLAANPEIGKHLTGLLNERWSYRFGDWRILYKIRKSELLVLILTVGHRSRIHKD